MLEINRESDDYCSNDDFLKARYRFSIKSELRSFRNRTSF